MRVAAGRCTDVEVDSASRRGFICSSCPASRCRSCCWRQSAGSWSGCPLFYPHAAPSLPPLGYSLFCSRYPDDCEVQKADFRRRNIRLTLGRWDELNTVNREVNRDIISGPASDDIATEEWRIYPTAGDCKDYVITKRHELLARGWPSRALLPAEVVAPSGEHHVVLVVRTKDVDLVLDNLNENVRSIAMTYRQYQWLRIESPRGPKFWTRVQIPRTASASN